MVCSIIDIVHLWCAVFSKMPKSKKAEPRNNGRNYRFKPFHSLGVVNNLALETFWRNGLQ